MTIRAWALSCALVALGCGGGATEDAGVDAGGDAGSDAGRLPDAGRLDAGPPRDAGDVGTLEMQSMMLEAEVTEFEAARDAAPMESRIDGSVLDLELGAGGIDALIGENGLQTLALSEATVRALADLMHANSLLDLLDGALSRLAGGSDPALDAMVSAATDMRAALVAYRDELRVLYRNRLAVGVIGLPDLFSFSDNQSTFGTGQVGSFGVILEQPSGTPAPTIFWNCELGRPDPTITVIDEATGAVLATGAPTSFTVPIPLDQVTAVRVTVDGPPREVGNYPECAFVIDTDRFLRVSPVDLSFHAERMSATSDYRVALSFLASADEDTRVAFPSSASVLDAVERQVAMMNDVVSALIGSPQSVPVEDLERLVRRHAYVDPMITALLASPQLASADFDRVRTDLATIQMHGRRLAAVAAAP